MSATVIGLASIGAIVGGLVYGDVIKLNPTASSSSPDAAAVPSANPLSADPDMDPLLLSTDDSYLGGTFDLNSTIVDYEPVTAYTVQGTAVKVLYNVPFSSSIPV